MQKDRCITGTMQTPGIPDLLAFVTVLRKTLNHEGVVVLAMDRSEAARCEEMEVA